MACPDRYFNQLSLKLIAEEIITNAYGTGFDGDYDELLARVYNESSHDSGISLKEDISNCSLDGEQINTNWSSDFRPDGSAPYKMSEFYSYDQDGSGSPSTNWSSLIDNINMGSTGVGGTLYSDTKTCVLNHGGGGNISFNCTALTGTMYMTVGDEGDPGTAGDDNNAAGWTQGGTSGRVMSVSDGYIYVKFKYVGHSSGTSAETSTATLNISGVTDTIEVTARTKT